MRYLLDGLVGCWAVFFDDFCGRCESSAQAWLPHLWTMGSFYWLSLRPTLHFVSVSGSLRDRRPKQSYKVKYLGLALALQVSVIILLQAFLLYWIIMEVWVRACHLSSVGGGSQREAAGQRNVCFSVMSSEEHKSKANWYCSPEKRRRSCTQTI